MKKEIKEILNGNENPIQSIELYIIKKITKERRLINYAWTLVSIIFCAVAVLLISSKTPSHEDILNKCKPIIDSMHKAYQAKLDSITSEYDYDQKLIN